MLNRQMTSHWTAVCERRCRRGAGRTLAILFFGSITFTVNPSIVLSDENSNVPDFLTLIEGEARDKAIRERIDLIVELRDSIDRIGRVFDQVPAPGATTPDGRVVVYISRGIEVPELRGMTITQAREELEAIGLGWDVTATPLLGYAPEVIGRQVPMHPERIDAETQAVFITVSSGTTKVPDVIGKTLDQAFELLGEANLQMQEVPDINWDRGARDWWSGPDFCGNSTTVRSRVTSSDPVRNEWVVSGSEVKLDYSVTRTLTPDPHVACPENTDPRLRGPYTYQQIE